MDATLVLVRHGQTTWVVEGRFQGSSDPPLSDLGLGQAAAVARRIAGAQEPPVLPVPTGGPRRIWHSPLDRAATTAHAIWTAGGRSATLTPERDLTELAQGDWEGRTGAEVQASWPAELAAWRTDPAHHHAPGGEPLPDGARRAATAVERILADLGVRLGAPDDPATVGRSPVLGYADARMGATTDAAPPVLDPWSVVVAHDGILRLVLLHLLGLSIDHYWSIPFGLCALTVVELRGGRARLRAHNLADHLTG
jgi:broad specificity phosphatase PhoE